MRMRNREVVGAQLRLQPVLVLPEVQAGRITPLREMWIAKLSMLLLEGGYNDDRRTPQIDRPVTDLGPEVP